MAPPRRTTSKENSRSPARSQNLSPSCTTRAFAERVQKARTRTSSSVPATIRVDASAAPGRKLTRLPAANPEGAKGTSSVRSRRSFPNTVIASTTRVQHQDGRDSCSDRAGPPDSAYRPTHHYPSLVPSLLSESTVSRRRPGQRRSMRAISQSAETPGVCTAPPKVRVE